MLGENMSWKQRPKILGPTFFGKKSSNILGQNTSGKELFN